MGRSKALASEEEIPRGIHNRAARSTAVNPGARSFADDRLLSSIHQLRNKNTKKKVHKNLPEAVFLSEQSGAWQQCLQELSGAQIQVRW